MSRVPFSLWLQAWNQSGILRSLAARNVRIVRVWMASKELMYSRTPPNGRAGSRAMRSQARKMFGNASTSVGR
jgi:hypothetical protein